MGDRGVAELPDPGDVEDDFDEDRAAEQRRDIEGEDRHDRVDRRPHPVMQHDATLGRPFARAVRM